MPPIGPSMGPWRSESFSTRPSARLIVQALIVDDQNFSAFRQESFLVPLPVCLE
jgi:hypothetical protein